MSECDSENGFSERLACVVRECNGVRAFLQACAENGSKISETGFRAYLKGTEPTRRVLVDIARTAGVNLEWLATGEGTPRGLPADAALAGQVLAVRITSNRPSLRPTISGVALDRTYLTDNCDDPGALELVFFESDVMEPRIVRGSVLLVDRSSTALSEGVFMIAVDGAETCRRLVYSEDGPAWHADNEAYPPIEIDGQPEHVVIDVLGRVMSVVRLSRV